VDICSSYLLPIISEGSLITDWRKTGHGHIPINGNTREYYVSFAQNLKRGDYNSNQWLIWHQLRFDTSSGWKYLVLKNRLLFRFRVNSIRI
jgi:hypothetical protein